MHSDMLMCHKQGFSKDLQLRCEVMDILKEFLESSTIHGLSYISTSRSKRAKSVWFFCILVSFSIFLIGKTTKEIEDDPFSTAITTHLIDELDFPLIIICPPERTNTQLFLTRSRKIKLFEPSEGIFIYNTKYWTTKKICKIGPLGPKEK